MTAPNQTHTVNPQNAARLSPSRTPEAHQKTGGATDEKIVFLNGSKILMRRICGQWINTICN